MGRLVFGVILSSFRAIFVDRVAILDQCLFIFRQVRRIAAELELS